MPYKKTDYIGGAVILVVLISTLIFSALNSAPTPIEPMQLFPPGHPRYGETWNYPRETRW